MTTEDALIVLFCEVDDWCRQHPLPQRPGPTPRCSDSEVLSLALARVLLLRDRSERHFLRRVRQDFPHLFPRLPGQSVFNRRVRWLWGAFEALRQHYLAQLPGPTEHWLAFDTTPLPVKHPSRVRRADQWQLPDGLRAGFGRCPATATWFYGFRLAVLTALIDPVPRVWALVPAAVNERDVLPVLLTGLGAVPVLVDKRLRSQALTAELGEHGIRLLVPPTRAERAQRDPAELRFIAAHRHRIESGFDTSTDDLALAQHRALTPWGLLTRVALILAAVTIRTLWHHLGRDFD
jgi:hypothetical protein